MKKRNGNKKKQATQQKMIRVTRKDRNAPTRLMLLKQGYSSAPVPLTRSVEYRYQEPKFSGDNLFRIRHTEPVAVLQYSSSFVNTTYYISPTRTLFPWLSSIAPSFDKWRLNTMRFKYVHNAPSTTTGSVYMFIDYDPTDNNEMFEPMDYMQNEGAIYGSLYSDHVIEYKGKRSELFTAMPLAAPDRLADAGQLLIGHKSGSAPDQNALGTLFVEYDITLLKPQPVTRPEYTGVGDQTDQPYTTYPSKGADPGAFATANSSAQFDFLRSVERMRELAYGLGAKFDEDTHQIIMPASVPYVVMQAFSRGGACTTNSPPVAAEQLLNCTGRWKTGQTIHQDTTVPGWSDLSTLQYDQTDKTKEWGWRPILSTAASTALLYLSTYMEVYPKTEL